MGKDLVLLFNCLKFVDLKNIYVVFVFKLSNVLLSILCYWVTVLLFMELIVWCRRYTSE